MKLTGGYAGIILSAVIIDLQIGGLFPEKDLGRNSGPLESMTTNLPGGMTHTPWSGKKRENLRLLRSRRWRGRKPSSVVAISFDGIKNKSEDKMVKSENAEPDEPCVWSLDGQEVTLPGGRGISAQEIIDAVNTQSDWTATLAADGKTVNMIRPEIRSTTISVCSRDRGWETVIDPQTQEWVYRDNGQAVTNRRACRRCGRPPTAEGYDACTGFIPGARYACCGHGVSQPYLIMKNGKEVEHPAALQLVGNKWSSAIFSPCRKYRYSLFRLWDSSKPVIVFIGLNPSTADEFSDDPTVRRCVNYAKAWGFGSFRMLNIFAFRATHPGNMKAQKDPIGSANDWILSHTVEEAGMTVCAWGAHGEHMDRGAEVVRLLKSFDLYALKITQTGQPSHPLYLKKNLQPFIFKARGEE